MAAPVTGPYVKSSDRGTQYQYSTSYRQERPYNIPTAFASRKGVISSYVGNYGADAWRFAAFAEAYNTDPRVYAQAYSRLVDKLGENAGLGVTLAQWKQADGMIRKRGNQLTSFTRALVRRSPIGVASALGIAVKRAESIKQQSVRYGTAKKLSDLWLEFWFGWKPMISDIYTACEVFDNFIPWAHLSGAAKRTLDERSGDSGLYSEKIRLRGHVGCKVGLDVRLVNPNVRLMQQFGILNPAEIVWDAIPWSFVVGWVANVGQWLSSFTDFAGFETSNGYISRRTVLDKCEFTWPVYPWYAYGTGVSQSRTLVSQLPRPRLMMNEFSMKPARALTSITLLSQQLHRVANAR